MERIALLVEPFDFVHMRRADQAAIERVGPGVIGALNRFGQPARGRFAQPGTAVATHVVVRATLTGLIAQNDDALAGDFYQEVIARGRERRIAADADPVSTENPLLLVGEHFRRRVIAARESTGTLMVAFDGLQEGHRIARAALRPAAPGIPPPGCVPEPHKYSPSMGIR